MPEEAAGSLAYVPGTHAGAFGGEVISGMMDPFFSNSAGAAWFNMTGGARTSGEELYTNFINATRFAKASGMGDVEVLCAWRAVGDRVWRDTDGNGQQDAGEADIAGVRLNLRDANGALLAQVTTGSVAGMTGNYRFYVNPYQSYTIEIDASNYAAGGVLFGLGERREFAVVHRVFLTGAHDVFQDRLCFRAAGGFFCASDGWEKERHEDGDDRDDGDQLDEREGELLAESDGFHSGLEVLRQIIARGLSDN